MREQGWRTAREAWAALAEGSLRGMRSLLRLARAGCSVWPFDPPGWPLVVEIYPRLLTGPVAKERVDERRRLLRTRFPGQDPGLMERAASSADAFDAAVSALVMDAHASELEGLAQGDGDELLEGRVWRPLSHSRA